MALTKIAAAGLTADLIDETKLADNSIDSEHYNDGSIDNAHLADDAVGVAELSATGTASSSTFLRGDNSWVTPTDTNTQLSTEQVQDIVGGMFTGNTETNITATYEDSDGTIDLVSTDTNTQLSTEEVQDIVGAMFTGNTETNITATYEDSDGTIDLVGSSGVGGATGVDFNDTIKARFGTGNDLELYHDGSNYGFIVNNTGDLIIKNDNSSTNAIRIRSKGDEEDIVCNANGAVELYYDNSKKFETYGSGVKTYGGYLRIVGDEGGVAQLDLYADEGDDAYDMWQVKAGGSSDFYINGWNGSSYETAIKATGNGAVELYYDNAKKLWTESWGISIDGNFALGDTEKLIFGGSDDFQIYHDGSDSYIIDSNAASDLFINSNKDLTLKIGDGAGGYHTAMYADNGGAVRLYHNDVQKFETTSAGGTLTGTWIGVGVQQYDEWRITSSYTGSATPISSNWERCDTSANGLSQNLPIGSGMSQSSGVFTFPTTGKWLVNLKYSIRHANENSWSEGYIQFTGNDGSNWANAAGSYVSQYNDSGNVYGGLSTEALLDIEDTGNDKVRFTVDYEDASNGTIIGNSTQNHTYITFTRLADT